MRELKAFLIFFFAVSIFSLSFNGKILASETCDIETNPSPVTNSTKSVDVTIKDTQGIIFAAGKEYLVYVDNKQLSGKNIFGQSYPLTFKPQNGSFTIKGFRDLNGFEAKDYVLSIRGKDTKQEVCHTALKVEPVCKIELLNKKYDQNENIGVKVQGVPGNPSDTRRITIKTSDGKDIKNWCNSVADFSNGISIGNYDIGQYQLVVFNDCTIREKPLCSAAFEVVPVGKEGGGIFATGSGKIIGLGKWSQAGEIPICKQENNLTICPTAIGDIETSPSGFISKIFGLILGLSGGIALLLIIISGYRIMASQGNPEKVKEAKESLTSAIVGLLFIIFSALILKIIGIDILNLPGFGILK